MLVLSFGYTLNWHKLFVYPVHFFCIKYYRKNKNKNYTFLKHCSRCSEAYLQFMSCTTRRINILWSWFAWYCTRECHACQTPNK